MWNVWMINAAVVLKRNRHKNHHFIHAIVLLAIIVFHPRPIDSGLKFPIIIRRKKSNRQGAVNENKIIFPAIYPENEQKGNWNGKITERKSVLNNNQK